MDFLFFFYSSWRILFFAELLVMYFCSIMHAPLKQHHKFFLTERNVFLLQGYLCSKYTIESRC